MEINEARNDARPRPISDELGDTISDIPGKGMQGHGSTTVRLCKIITVVRISTRRLVSIPHTGKWRIHTNATCMWYQWHILYWVPSSIFPAQPRLALNWFKIASYFSDSDTEALAVCSSWWHQNVVFSRAKSRSARSCPIAIMHHLTPNLLSLAKQGDVFKRLWFCSDMSWNLSKELMNHPKEIGPFTFTLQILKHIQYRQFGMIWRFSISINISCFTFRGPSVSLKFPRPVEVHLFPK